MKMKKKEVILLGRPPFTKDACVSKKAIVSAYVEVGAAESEKNSKFKLGGEESSLFLFCLPDFPFFYLSFILVLAGTTC